MSCLHRRSASTTLFERLHRTIFVVSGVFGPVEQRAGARCQTASAPCGRRFASSRRACAAVSSAVALRAPLATTVSRRSYLTPAAAP